MKIVKIDITTPTPKIMPMRDMPHGKFAVVIDTAYEGSIVFRIPHFVRRVDKTSEEFIVIANQRSIPFDTFNAGCPVMVRVLDAGEAFKITL